MIRTGISWHRRVLVSLVAGSACLTSSCSLFNPHVSPSLPVQTYREPTPAELQKMSAAERKAVEDGPHFAGGVGRAIDHVNSWRQAYYDAVGEQSMMKNGVAMAVIPAAAVAAYFGITGGSREVITGLATGAAGVLGLGVFFESENRQKIYLSGYRSMGCLLYAAAPLLMPEKQYEALQNDEQSLDTDLGKLEQAIADTRTATELLRAKQEQNAMLVEAEIAIAGANQLVLKAQEAQAGARGLIGRITWAGEMIETAAGNISAEVSTQIVEDESRLDSLTTITGGIPGTAEKIARIPPAKEKPAETEEAETNSLGTAEEIALDARLKALAIAVDNVTAKARRLQLTVNQYADVTQSLQNIKGCGFEKVDLKLKIEPNETSVELKTGKTHSILISGGNSPYSVKTAGQVPEGVTVSPVGFGEPVIAEVTAGTKTGEFDVGIADASHSSVMVHFTIVPDTATGGDGGGGGNDDGGGGGSGGNGDNGGGNGPQALGGGVPPSQAAVNEEAQRNIKEFRVAQFGVGLRGEAVDGDVKETTRDKVREFQTAQGLAATGVIDDGLYNRLVPIVEADWANARPLLGCEIEETRNVFECTKLNKSMVSAMQKKLPVAETGILDQETRAKIRAAAEEPTDRPADREALSPGLIEAIIARS